MERKIISTFMFSEPYEQELLWLKFNVENDFISEWFITESSYTFQGKGKDISLPDILKQDRFAPFLNKITILNVSENYNFDFEPFFITIFKRRLKRLLNTRFGRSYELVCYAELASFYAEVKQRQYAFDYICNKYSADDILIACDTDEIFDFSGAKREEFDSIIKNNKTPFYIKREIYCYDYNNITHRDRYSPIVKIGDIGEKNNLHDIRHPNPLQRIIISTQNKLAFEYTFCFSREAMLKKLISFAHVTDVDESTLFFCLENNISLINPKSIDHNFLSIKDNLYDIVELTEDNTPVFLLNNIDCFRTNTVSHDYLNNRRKSLEN
jgi:hypothetical protein